ncbi:MAG TPA: crotonase/enoyl-CoA hydratase family protein [Woeseiaceae bacterium]
MADRVSIEINDRIAEVILNRPDKFNAVDFPMWQDLADAGRQIAADTSVRAVVLHGAGSHFCSGIDVTSFQEAGAAALQGNAMQALPDSPANLFQEAAYIWRRVPVPVIAALRGYVFGAGLQIAAGADIRYATPDAKLSIMEMKWGIIPDIAITATLRNVVPIDKLKELTFTGRIIDGATARDIGLVTGLHDDPLQAARDLATEIAAKSPHAMRAAKKLFNDAWDDTLPAGLRLEATLQQSLMGSPNQLEAVMANLQKRPADFRDPD